MYERGIPINDLFFYKPGAKILLGLTGIRDDLITSVPICH